MTSELAWYLFAAVVVFATTPLITGALFWVFTPPRSKRKTAILLELVGFLVAILIYAWALDSRRIEYREWALWLLLGIGALGIGILEKVTHKGGG